MELEINNPSLSMQVMSGGAEPEEYLKSAAVNSNTLTLTKKDNTTVVYTPTVPTKTSDLTNDSGFLTEHQSLANYSTTTEMNTAISNHHDSTKQDTLVSGTNIKTVNNNSLLGSGNISITAEDEIFVIDWENTTLTEIGAAYEAGKTLIVKDGNIYATCSRAAYSGTSALFYFSAMFRQSAALYIYDINSYKIYKTGSMTEAEKTKTTGKLMTCVPNSFDGKPSGVTTRNDDVYQRTEFRVTNPVPDVPDTTNNYVLKSIAGVLTWVQE